MEAGKSAQSMALDAFKGILRRLWQGIDWRQNVNACQPIKKENRHF